jgi:hypothetical protein
MTENYYLKNYDRLLLLELSELLLELSELLLELSELLLEEELSELERELEELSELLLEDELKLSELLELDDEDEPSHHSNITSPALYATPWQPCPCPKYGVPNVLVPNDILYPCFFCFKR